MGMLAFAAIIGAVALGLAFAGGGAPYPTVPVVIVALCKALAERGESAPLPASSVADQDLAVRAVKLLGLPGSWPPVNADPATKRAWFNGVMQLAARVRSGEIRCSPDGGGDSGGGDSGGGDSGGGDSGGGDSGGGDSESLYPTMPLATVCQALRERGEAAPLPPSYAADQDLAVRSIKLLGLPGSWPPPSSDPLAKRTWFASVVNLASQVRSGAIACEQDEADAPNFAAIQQAICGILMPLADPESHYLEIGKMPAAAAVDVADTAIQSLGADPAAIPPAVRATATKYALDVIEGRIACGIVDGIVTPGAARAPGKWLQLKWGDNLLEIAGDTYGVGAGSRRTELAKLINDHPYNLGLHVPTTVAWNKTNIGPTMISFFNKWRPTPKTVLQRFEAGNGYAVIYLPEL